jgi:hypothetical protein
VFAYSNDINADINTEEESNCFSQNSKQARGSGACRELSSRLLSSVKISGLAYVQ